MYAEYVKNNIYIYISIYIYIYIYIDIFECGSVYM